MMPCQSIATISARADEWGRGSPPHVSKYAICSSKGLCSTARRSFNASRRIASNESGAMATAASTKYRARASRNLSREGCSVLITEYQNRAVKTKALYWQTMFIHFAVFMIGSSLLLDAL